MRRSNVVLDRPPVLATQSMPVGNGVMGAAVWAQNGFTAQLGRTDTFPTRRSPGQVVIPGLEAMTTAPDYRATVELYDAGSSPDRRRDERYRENLESIRTWTLRMNMRPA